MFVIENQTVIIDHFADTGHKCCLFAFIPLDMVILLRIKECFYQLFLKYFSILLTASESHVQCISKTIITGSNVESLPVKLVLA